MSQVFRVDYTKQIEGLCFVEDVLDLTGKPITKAIFNNKCEIIMDAMMYLKKFRDEVTNSYNTLNRVAHDLCHFYDFLVISQTEVGFLDKSHLKEFISYIHKVKSKREIYLPGSNIRKVYSIERSIYKKVPTTPFYNDDKIKYFNSNETLEVESVERIFKRVIHYLKFLESEGQRVLLKGKVSSFNKTTVNGILKANGVQPKGFEIDPVETNEIFTEIQIKEMYAKALGKTSYGQLLLFLLEKTGMRIGEALGLMIDPGSILSDVRSIEGDVQYKDEDGKWEINVIYRTDNPNDSRAKSHKNRTINILDKDSCLFERLLERYCKWRKKKVKERSSWLLLSSRGSKLTENTAEKWFKNLLANSFPELKKTHTLHSYRHTFCTIEMLKGTPLEMIAKLVGHKNSQVTFDTYIHATQFPVEEIRIKYPSYLKNCRASYWKIND